MYGWLANPVDIDESLQVSQFTLVDYVQSDCAQNYTAGAATVSSIYSHAWASAHRGKWGQLTPPGKSDEKLRSENTQKRAVFYVYVIF